MADKLGRVSVAIGSIGCLESKNFRVIDILIVLKFSLVSDISSLRTRKYFCRKISIVLWKMYRFPASSYFISRKMIEREIIGNYDKRCKNAYYHINQIIL